MGNTKSFPVAHFDTEAVVSVICRKAECSSLILTSGFLLHVFLFLPAFRSLFTVLSNKGAKTQVNKKLLLFRYTGVYSQREKCSIDSFWPDSLFLIAEEKTPPACSHDCRCPILRATNSLKCLHLLRFFCETMMNAKL